MKKIYLDYAATTPVDPRVAEAMQPYFTQEFGNASSPHQYGQRAKKAMEDARDTVANVLGCDTSEIIFTSGATESNNHAVFGLAQVADESRKHIIVSRIEHHSVLEPIEYLKKYGYTVTYLNVDTQGCIDPQEVADVITDRTLFVAVIHASNEIGTIQSLAEIGKITRQHNVPFLVDAVQAVGHIPVKVNDFNCDLLSLSAHKFYGPKGVGALYIRKGIKFGRYLFGGDQERNRRASTQNVPGIVGLGKALELSLEVMDEEAQIQIELRDSIIDFILDNIEGAQLNGHRQERLPNNINVSFDNVEAENLITSLDMKGIACSMGSACTSGNLEPSHVLTALGRSKEEAFSSLRITLGRWTTKEDVQILCKELKNSIEKLRA